MKYIICNITQALLLQVYVACVFVSLLVFRLSEEGLMADGVTEIKKISIYLN